MERLGPNIRILVLPLETTQGDRYLRRQVYGDYITIKTKPSKPPDYDMSAHMDVVHFVLDPDQLSSFEHVLRHYEQWLNVTS